MTLLRLLVLGIVNQEANVVVQCPKQGICTDPPHGLISHTMINDPSFHRNDAVAPEIQQAALCSPRQFTE